MLMERGLMGQESGGYFIRGVVPIHPTPRPNRWVGPSTDNKENINPATRRVVEPTRQGRSSLPNWYPRTPLRDITAILKVIERREQRRAAIAARQPDPNTGSAEEPSPPLPEQQTPEPANDTALVATPDRPPITLRSREEEYVKKLSESIEQLEKILMKNVKRDNAQKNRSLKRDVQRKALLSMR
ncbi:hypothetical protein LUZ62_060803 [Rhynchospora pubera]|uniref:Uncharacterized protein n=1 Tax=Rhynchospora pubera TaxID=906938 RepID=A0AAV8EEH9_9POAL|nr:hypothetical protein LUZ62_060803 [Rhynchospora pubera]